MLNQDSGNYFYYNSATDIYSWEQPENWIESPFQENTLEFGEGVGSQLIESPNATCLSLDQEEKNASGEYGLTEKTECNVNAQVSMSDVFTEEERNLLQKVQSWSVCGDPESGKSFYYNSATGKSFWEKPEELEDAEQKLVQRSSAMSLQARASMASILGPIIGEDEYVTNLGAIEEGMNEFGATYEGNPEEEWEYHRDPDTGHYYAFNKITGFQIYIYIYRFV